MIRILFICHGNICRSVAAEMVMKDMAERHHRADGFLIDSAATSWEEIGNDIYPPMKRALHGRGYRCRPHAARRMEPADYERYDMLIGMDRENMFEMRRMYRGDPGNKLSCLLDHAGRPGQEVADPWYTRDFGAALDDIEEGCRGLLKEKSTGRR